jgi:hypothetical protein
MEVCLKMRQDFPSLEMDKPAIQRLGMETSSVSFTDVAEERQAGIKRKGKSKLSRQDG